MSAADEEARRLAWIANQDEIAQARKVYDALLIGDPVAAAAFKAKWQPYVDYMQERYSYGEEYESGSDRPQRIN